MQSLAQQTGRAYRQQWEQKGLSRSARLVVRQRRGANHDDSLAGRFWARDASAHAAPASSGRPFRRLRTPPPPPPPPPPTAAATATASHHPASRAEIFNPRRLLSRTALPLSHLRPHPRPPSLPPPPSSSLSSHRCIRCTRPSLRAGNIASQRSAQLARHFSASASSKLDSNLHRTLQPHEMASQYGVRKVAAPNTLEHRVYIEKDGVPVSPFHDIPLYANQDQTILNMIVEIPRWTNAKLEISKDELLNPIKQDIKKGKLRYVRNCFPHKGYLWNYGAFPQTWEDPNAIHPETKAKGDNDPLDVCEIGELVGYVGQVKQVKVLGVMALLDEEETDWKVIVVDVNDPLAPKLNDVEDVERHLPGLLRATNEWFRIYKIPDGKPENQFAFTGECKNKSYAMDVIHECAEAWEKLITGKTQPGGISTTNLAVSHSPSRVTPDQLPPLPANENLAPEKIDSSIDKWFFISGAAA
ncbi:inorganic pyrophosphatase [Xylariaceae sp. FL1019]|nr:inorganic pyrophosphatase [Xylariaceae sp. FL1019]